MKLPANTTKAPPLTNLDWGKWTEYVRSPRPEGRAEGKRRRTDTA